VTGALTRRVRKLGHSDLQGIILARPGGRLRMSAAFAATSRRHSTSMMTRNRRGKSADQRGSSNRSGGGLVHTAADLAKTFKLWLRVNQCLRTHCTGDSNFARAFARPGAARRRRHPRCGDKIRSRPLVIDIRLTLLQQRR